MSQNEERIAYADNPVMAIAFAGFLRWVASEPGALDAFEHATGIRPFWAERRTPLEQMIDKATDRERQQIDAFVDWAVANIWGDNPWGKEAHG
ncbi:hypothetical protein AFIC_001022 [[Pseudomonas] carboxydohydrogena]|uniref:Uncharacterized protein n=1 Tax=Afipia carboxydohydrogena TaxID=290 RepID=A0ABY8BT70_AFICR|nr:hypothetical protein [[Pseudomonas] carboxydohydrogena]WEF52531.1 hypothetical protein AFIC_001022 [[Pseudomonas] carboxydohydrogena]